jgi:hypothetical protein
MALQQWLASTAETMSLWLLASIGSKNSGSKDNFKESICV